MTKKILTFLILITLIACEKMEEPSVQINPDINQDVSGKFLASVKPTVGSEVSFWEVDLAPC